MSTSRRFGSSSPGVHSKAASNYYSIYRQGLIERHICQNGRILEGVWLVEKRRGSTAAAPGFDEIMRSSQEIVTARSSAGLEGDIYEAYPLLIPWRFYGPEPQFFIAGGGDNPLLMSGLAMGVFAIEAIHGVSAHSLDYARQLLAFVEASEATTKEGVGTGFLVRKRHHWAPSMPASVDELTGLLLGLLLLHQASKKAGDLSLQERVRSLVERIGAYLKSKEYLIAADDAYVGAPDTESAGPHAWVYQFPLGRVFKEVVGRSFRMERTIPADLDPMLLGFGLLVAYIKDWLHFDFSGYQPKDLFKDQLELLPGVYTVKEFAFFNLTMTTYCILMTLMPEVVAKEVKESFALAGNTFFKQLCNEDSLADAVAKPAYNNALFGIAARLCYETQAAIPIVGDADADWEARIHSMINGLKPGFGKWFWDLPLGCPKEREVAEWTVTGPVYTEPHDVLYEPRDGKMRKTADQAPRTFNARGALGEFLWGEHYAWTKTGEKGRSKYSYTNDPWWDFGDASGRIGPATGVMDGLSEEALLPKYDADFSQGLRLEASGIDFLFATALAYHLGYLTVPVVDDRPYGVLPVDGPVGEGYLGNVNTRECHDLSAVRGDCQIGEIAPENQRWFAKAQEAVEQQFDPCGHCIGSSW